MTNEQAKAAAFQLADQLAERVAHMLMGERPVHKNYKKGMLSKYLASAVFINGYLKFILFIL